MAQGQGITSLMPGQAPAPGQSAQPIPGMQPPMGGPSAGVVDLVGPLKNLPEQVLTMELMNPQSKLEKYAVLAALDQKNRERKTMQAVQGMMAQQQNAQMQGQGTVAQQVAQEAQGARAPVMAAHGGLMRSYAGGGGIVAFNQGGITDAEKAELMRLGMSEETIDRAIRQGLKYEDLRRYSFGASQPVTSVIASPEEQVAPVEAPLKQRLARSEGIQKALRMPEIKPAAVAKGLITGGKPDFYTQEFQDPDALMREIAGETRPLPKTALPPEFAAPPSQRLMDTRAIPAPRSTGEEVTKTRLAPPPAPAPAPAPVTTGIPAALQAQFDEQRAALKGQMQKPAELTKKEAGLDALMQQRIREEEGRSAEPAAEAMKALQEALRRREEFDPGDWFRLAASIDPRRGYEFKSMGEGLAGIMERKAQAAEAARKELVAAQREQRQLQSKVAELRILAQQEQVLRENKEFDRANAVRDKMFGLEKDIFALQRDIQEKERDYGLKQRQVAAQEKTARAAEISAGRPTDFDKKLQLLKDDPATYRRMYGDEEAEKMLRLRAQLLKDYSANMNTLQLQGINSFEDYAALMGPSLMGASAGMSVPPAGAVREKGK